MRPLIASVIVNVVGSPGRRIVLFKEGGFHVEAYVKGHGWTLDNDALTDQESAAVLDDVSRLAKLASDNA